MHVKCPHKRLLTLWGKIDSQHNEKIMSHISGRKVLDIGSGYGALVNFLTVHQFDVTGLEPDRDCIEGSRALFGPLNIINTDIRGFQTSEKFDTIICKDSFHHLYGEDDGDLVLEKIKTLMKPNGVLIIWDPNLNWLLKACRFLIRHHDFEAPVDIVKPILSRHRFKIKETNYFEVIGLALSGGYVGIRLVPNIDFLHKILERLNMGLSSLMVKLKLGKYFCWRYCIVAQFV